MKTAIVTLYTFDELSKNAKLKVLNEYISFMIDTDYDSPNFKKAIDKAEEMATPWFASEYIWDYCKDEILKQLDTDICLYLSNGEIFSTN